MFLKVCRSSAADEDAHRGSDKRTMLSLRNPFQIQTRKDPKALNGGPPLHNKSSSRAKVTNNSSKRGTSHSGRIGARKEFLKVTTQGLGTQESYSNLENLPSLEVSYKSFKQMYPRFSETVAVDRLREREYGHLAEREHACFDYSGFGLFSHWQQVGHLVIDRFCPPTVEVVYCLKVDSQRLCKPVFEVSPFNLG